MIKILLIDKTSNSNSAITNYISQYPTIDFLVKLYGPEDNLKYPDIVFIAVEVHNFDTQDTKMTLEICKKEYQNVHVLLNNLGKVRHSKEVKKIIIKYFEKLGEKVISFDIDTVLIQNIFNLGKLQRLNSKWMRSLLKKKVKKCVPYNKYITNIVNCKWYSKIKYLNNISFEVSTCRYIDKFINKFNNLFERIDYDYSINNLKIELIYIICRKKIHNRCVKHKSKDCGHVEKNCNTLACKIDFDFVVDKDFTIVQKDGIYYFVEYFTVKSKVKIVNYYCVEIDFDLVKSYLKHLKF